MKRHPGTRPDEAASVAARTRARKNKYVKGLDARTVLDCVVGIGYRAFLFALFGRRRWFMHLRATQLYKVWSRTLRHEISNILTGLGRSKIQRHDETPLETSRVCAVTDNQFCGQLSLI